MTTVHYFIFQAFIEQLLSVIGTRERSDKVDRDPVFMELTDLEE